MTRIPPEVANYFKEGVRKVVSVRTEKPYTLIAEFDNGARRSVDMTADLCGVFEPLRNYDLFRNVGISPDGTIAWNSPSGLLDIDKDTVYIYGTSI